MRSMGSDPAVCEAFHGCLAPNKVGTGGSGHYVKMAHNGIEVGMMSGPCEVWSLLGRGLG